LRSREASSSTRLLGDFVKQPDAFYPPEPDLACKALFVQLSASSGGLAVLALRPPPGFLIAAADTWGWDQAAMLIWPGMMSVGVAAFGANAHAAGRAF
jgi:hypothetical protein